MAGLLKNPLEAEYETRKEIKKPQLSPNKKRKTEIQQKIHKKRGSRNEKGWILYLLHPVAMEEPDVGEYPAEVQGYGAGLFEL